VANASNGTYDLQFALFDASSSGATQIGSTLTRSGVSVNGGICATGFYLGRAMMHVVRNGAPKRMLENRDLRTLGEA